MSNHYETFYCLEKTIRALVADTLEVAEWRELVAIKSNTAQHQVGGH